MTIYRDRSGDYRWLLRSSNGEPLARSIGYTTSTSARRAALSVLRAAWEIDYGGSSSTTKPADLVPLERP